ncbi:MAG: manganese efflux pump MntP family protein [Clostridiales bacterium]|jgi:putative Mn2+ efflux pump MntP|nr:manganese efflux pump MntP family protein [Clostridiales bacterium]
MDIFTILIIAVGLAMDAFAVSVANSVSIKKVKPATALKFGCYFGGFQFLMPVAGFYFGSFFSKYVNAYGHWVAFGVLLVIGGKMFIESFKEEETEPAESVKAMLIFAVATSIDALTVGVSFALTDVPVWRASGIIGIVAFVFSAAGVYLGSKAGGLLGAKAERVGGIVLIAIGIKIIVEKLFF